MGESWNGFRTAASALIQALPKLGSYLWPQMGSNFPVLLVKQDNRVLLVSVMLPRC
jgi:hypothetical protein